MRILILGVLILLLNLNAGSLFGQQQTSSSQEPPAQQAAPAAAVPQQGAAQQSVQEIQKNLTSPAPVMEIKRLESEKPIYSIELRDVELADLFRVIAHDYNLNILVDKDVQGKVTASFTNISLDETLEAIAEMSNLVFEKKGNIMRVSPNLITKIFVLLHIEAKKILAGSASSQSGTVAAGATGGKSENTIYDLLSSKGKILLGQQPNSVIVIDYPPNIERIENYFKVIDKRMTSKIFNLKYLKASDLVGDTASSSASSTSATSTQTSTGGK